jgi:hypothetical protein
LKRRAHSESGSSSADSTHLLRRASEWVIARLRPSPPLCFCLTTLFHATNGVFLPPSFLKPQRKSLKILSSFFMVAVGILINIMWYTGIAYRTCLMSKTRPGKVRILVDQERSLSLIQSMQKLCPQGAPRYRWMVLGVLIWQPVLWSQSGVLDRPNGIITDLLRLSRAPDASSYTAKQSLAI